MAVREVRMSARSSIPPIRVLPENVANKIAAGEVVERPASVVKELLENALDARATRIQVRLVAAGRRTIEVIDNGHGMSEQDAMLAIERHATSKIRKAEDLDNIVTLGFRGEALASIAAVSRFELVTRRERDDSATRIRVEGGILREVDHVAAPVGTRVSVNRLYFNTPVRAKFLKGVTTELSLCIDMVQRHTLVQPGVGFHLTHNDKTLLEVPDRATLRERVALIWGLSFLKDLVEIDGEQAGLTVRGLIGTPVLTRSQRSHQFFFLNRRPVMNRSLQYGFEGGYRGLLTVGRSPVGILLIEAHPRFVDVNIHPAKREVRFRDERAAREAIRSVVRQRLEQLHDFAPPFLVTQPVTPVILGERTRAGDTPEGLQERAGLPAASSSVSGEAAANPLDAYVEPVQTEFGGAPAPVPAAAHAGFVAPSPVYRPIGHVDDAPFQVFDTYLLVPEEDRILIIDQHALHERLTYDSLVADLKDHDYQAQQLVVPILVELPPSHAKLMEANLPLFSKLGIEMEPFGGTTFQVTAICRYGVSRAGPACPGRLVQPGGFHGRRAAPDRRGLSRFREGRRPAVFP
jgi:DNA mismatch repair protein MutL